ncbi:nucleoside hydrolase [Trichothermofontia sichuanensis B231]|uniref:nucleoside hydrolase n=1 Tax=Trichothermofontia sichuanensis TaxID=3045816 RepID=UPI0022452877|nr:nucleoside hydrolase [Trichothermofontia sichuanensis]UZQ56181.1 nucleoside hydrolase [Trichothermofontia sichuanensis B231]
MSTLPASQLRPILLDTDPGGDDAIALLWLLSLVKQGLADLVAVTTVAGNVPAQQTFNNASQLLHLTGFSHIPVGRANRDRPTPAHQATYIHGADGLGNLTATLPPATHLFTQAPTAADLIIERLTAAPGRLTIVAIGPLTNLAAAEQQSPGILKLAEEIVIMGGVFSRPGNITAQAEFNLWFDPAAAQVVFNSRTDIVILPLDVTQHVRFKPEMAQAIAATATTHPISHFLLKLVDFMVQTALTYRATEGIPSFLVHDATTLAYLFYPETLGFQRAWVHVETLGEWTSGETLIDQRAIAKPRPNAWVALRVDAEGMLMHLVADLKLLLN